MLLPMLHATQRVTDAASFDLRLLAIGAALAAATATFAALAGPARLRRSRSRQALALTGGGVLAALAILPSVLPYDHLLSDPRHAAEHASVHASHCHDTPASCADAPLTAGPDQLLGGSPLLALPAMLTFVLLAAAAPALRGLTRRPDLPPPVAIACYA